MIGKFKGVFTLVTIFMVLLVFVMNDDEVRKFAPFIFLLQFISSTVVAREFKDKVFYFFSPSFFATAYVNLNYFIGGYSLHNNLAIDTYQYRNVLYNNLSDVNVAVAFLLICSCISILMLNESKVVNREHTLKTISSKYSLSKLYGNIAVCLILIILFSLFEVNLSFIGGEGDFSTIPKTIASLILFYQVSKAKLQKRFFIYLFTFFIFVFTNFESKREAVFLLIPILFLESYFGNIDMFRLSLRKLILSVAFAIVLIYLILVMTIARGFGEYPLNNNPLNSIKYVPALVDDYNLLALIATTSEAPTTTYHSVKAITLALQDPSLLTYGSTYFKLFFIPLPKSIFEYKPLSMTSIFTSIEDPWFYSIGGSLPINMFSEAFWNFHLIGGLFIAILMLFFNKVYKWLFNNIIDASRSRFLIGVLFAYTYLIGFYRGFGFDLYSVFIIIGFLFSILFFRLVSKRKVN